MIAIYGGTFDPCHNGHLQSIAELRQLLLLDKVLLIPCHQPPHRGEPHCSSQQRLAMLALAVQQQPGLFVDGRELCRDGPSYTVDTLQTLREEFGPQQPLCFVMGSDALAGLASWHHWQRIPELAHIVVMARPGWALPATGEVADLLATRTVAHAADLSAAPAGAVWPVTLTPVPLAATDLRRAIASGEDVSTDLPVGVWEYIQEHQLYR